MTTAYMLLSLPIVSTTLGPAWATQLNSALTVVDMHDHTSGKGTKVPSSGLNINAALPFGGNSATGLATTTFTDQGSALSAATVGALYIAGGELYFNNGSGTSLKLTQGGALNASSLGGFGGDYATSTAAAAYWTASKSFQYTQSSNVAALVDAGPVLIRKVASWSAVPQGAGLAGVTLAVGAAISTPWTLTLPATVPGANNSFTVVSTAGVESYVTADASTVEVNGTSLRVKDSGITTAKINASAVSNDKLANFNYATGSVTSSIVISKLNNNGTTGFEGSWTRICSATINRANLGRPVSFQFSNDTFNNPAWPGYYSYVDVSTNVFITGTAPSTNGAIYADVTSTSQTPGNLLSKVKVALLDITANTTMSSWNPWTFSDSNNGSVSSSIPIARNFTDFSNLVATGQRTIVLQAWLSGAQKFSASLTVFPSASMYISEI